MASMPSIRFNQTNPPIHSIQSNAIQPHSCDSSIHCSWNRSTQCNSLAPTRISPPKPVNPRCWIRSIHSSQSNPLTSSHNYRFTRCTPHPSHQCERRASIPTISITSTQSLPANSAGAIESDATDTIQFFHITHKLHPIPFTSTQSIQFNSSHPTQVIQHNSIQFHQSIRFIGTGAPARF